MSHGDRVTGHMHAVANGLVALRARTEESEFQGPSRWA